MTTMRCEAVRDALPALVRGTASDAEAAALREHIAGCETCGAEAGIAQALARVSALESSAVPAGLAERISVELERRHSAGVRARSGLPRPIRWSAGAALAAAAMIALVLVWPERAERGGDDSPGRVSATDDDPAIAALAGSPAEADPFLDDGLFAEDAVPLDAELDDVLEGVDPAALGVMGGNGAVPPLAMDIGAPTGDWPGADDAIAGAVLLDVLTYEEMRLLLSEMDT